MKRSADQWRAYRAKRRAAGNAVGRKRTTYRKRVSTRMAQPFIAWDGEGHSLPDGSHRYVILANSLGESLVREAGLSTIECLDFILRTAHANPRAIHVGFGLGYDVTMILRDVSREIAEALVRTKVQTRGVDVHAGGKRYSFRYRPRKRLTIAQFDTRPFVFSERARGWIPNFDRRVTLWDVFGYFQTSFVGALRSNKIALDVVDRIEEMKRARHTFGAENLDEQLAYCISECRALVALCDDLRESLRDAELLSGIWDGPGAVAGTLFRKRGVKQFIEQEPAHLSKAIASAYFGGRIEAPKIGFGRDLFEADIVSAYPAAIRELPSLVGGQWRSVPIREIDASAMPFGICHVRWSFPWGAAPFYPLPFRLADGSVRFPREGAGWYYFCEVAAALEHAARFGGAFLIDEAWAYSPATSEKPFAFIDDLFATRAAWKAQGRGGEKALKLALNSCYGKTVSQLGAKLDEAGNVIERPAYFSFVWGGAITAHTRATLLRAALQAPESVILFATDALYTTRELSLPIGKSLGAWETARHEEGVFAQPGVYWLRSGVGPAGWKAKFRGFDREGMERPYPVLDAWARNRRAIDVPSTRFVTLKLAIARNDYARRGTWETTPRRLALNGGGKRFHLEDVRSCARELVATWPADLPPGIGESLPYDSLLWRDRRDREEEPPD